MGVEEHGLGGWDYQGGMVGSGGGVGEVGAHPGDGVEGEGEGVEDDGDEGGSAAEGLGDGLAVAVEDVMAVVADDEAAAGNDGFGVCDHDHVKRLFLF